LSTVSITTTTESPVDLRPFSRAQRQVVATLAIVYVLLASSLSVSAALPELRQTIAMSDAVTSLHSSFFGWALLPGGLLGGRLITRFGNRRILMCSVTLMSGGAIIFGFGRSVEATLTGAGALGVGAAMVVVAMPGIVADLFASRRNEVFTRLNVAPVFGGALFTLSLAAATSVGRWRIPVVFFPALCMVLLAVVVRGIDPQAIRPLSNSLENHTGFTPQSPASHKVERPSVRATFQSPGFSIRWVLLTLAVTIEFSVGSWMITFLRENVGLSKGVAPLAGVAWGAGMLCSRSFTPQLVRIAKGRLETCGFLFMAFGIAVLILTPITIIRVIGIAITAIAIGPTYPLGVERLFVCGSKHATSTVSATGALASGVAITLGPLSVGVVSDRFGLSWGLTVPIVLAFIGAASSALRWGDEGGALGAVLNAATPDR
jgi:MFS family permease